MNSCNLGTFSRTNAIALLLLCFTFSSTAQLKALLPDSLTIERLTKPETLNDAGILLREISPGTPAVIDGTLVAQFNDSAVANFIKLPFTVSDLKFEKRSPTLFYSSGNKVGYFDIDSDEARPLIEAPDSVSHIAPFVNGIFFSCANKVYLSDFDNDTVKCVIETVDPVTDLHTEDGDIYAASGEYIFGVTYEGQLIPVARVKGKVESFSIGDSGNVYAISNNRLLMISPGNKIMPLLNEAPRQILWVDGKLYVALNDGSMLRIRKKTPTEISLEKANAANKQSVSPKGRGVRRGGARRR